ncbi:glutamate 5-kinase [Campylobacter sp. JMF_08 NE1]|uniref:glutamate 5-kinase n=1 Tax=Campylobacter sp. JMF_08 NE1 TaxID=2983821 RepID=UPI0022E9AB10|nr:glutamate 5-kinase [Campylobacter sp. JMF_08 NE1]MDA3047641.1 glutamate 5-kinase [Campylobacter sp. JMF_08 NE1]
MRKDLLKNTKKIIVKVGTSTLTNSDGSLNETFIKSLVAQICELKAQGYQVVLVSSGAVGAGMGILKIEQKPKELSAKQALAAVGQVALMHLYERLFWAHDEIIAQLLLTRIDFSDRARYLSARNVATALLSQGIIPIINENDPVSGDELKIGDNDTMSALVTGLIDADLLVLLSDIDGLYDKNPSTNPDAKLIKIVNFIDENTLKMAGDVGSKFGTGGMATKLSAAKMATKIGANMIIANGKESKILAKIIAGEEVGTIFCKEEKSISAKKYWLAYGANVRGAISLDEGACKAIKNGKSVLGVGIVGVSGEFERGDVIEILGADSQRIARGIANYCASEISLIMGKKSSEYEKILPSVSDDYIVHANNIVLG